MSSNNLQYSTLLHAFLRQYTWYFSKFELIVHRVHDILYFYCVEIVAILLIWNAIREFVTEKLIQLWWNADAHGRSRMCEDISVSCQVET